MKQILTVVLLIVACTFSTRLPARPQERESTQGGGQIASKEIPTPNFEALYASRGVRILLTDQPGNIRIEADEELLEQVIVKTDGNELQITVDKRINAIDKHDITITVPVAARTIRTLKAASAARIEAPGITLSSTHLLVKASSAARIEATVKAQSCQADASSAAHIGLSVEAPECRFEASSAAKIEARIDAESCTASATSAAGIDLTGVSTYFEGESNSTGKIDAGALSATRASVKASSGSGITLLCSEELDAHASSGASIRYSGDCRVNASKSSGGSIRKK